MNVARAVLVALIAAGACAGVTAQWKWRDRSGVMQYSDLPPPHGTPDKDILERPQLQRRAPAAAPTEAASAPRPTAAASAVGPDPELEARLRKAEIDKADKAGKAMAERRAEEQRLAAARADNCQRARTTLRGLEDGLRMARTNAQGEREVLDDAARAAEITRMRSVVASDCVN